jgi:hypothetical protein
MKLVDRVETQERVEKLTEEEKDSFFTKMVMGQDVTEEVDTTKGRFTLKYPKTSDIVMIGKVAAFRRNYKPVECFDAETEMLNMMASTLDVVVVSGPKWYEDAKTMNKNFSFMEVPSRGFLAELYGKAYSFREKVELRLNPPEGPTDIPVPAKDGNDDAVDGGAFGGISSEPDNS